MLLFPRFAEVLPGDPGRAITVIAHIGIYTNIKLKQKLYYILKKNCGLSEDNERLKMKKDTIGEWLQMWYFFDLERQQMVWRISEYAYVYYWNVWRT